MPEEGHLLSDPRIYPSQSTLLSIFNLMPDIVRLARARILASIVASGFPKTANFSFVYYMSQHGDLRILHISIGTGCFANEPTAPEGHCMILIEAL